MTLSPDRALLPPVLSEPAEQRVEWMTVDDRGRARRAHDAQQALDRAQSQGHRRFCRTVITTDWSEVRTHLNGQPR